jgi:hypothetical protein
MANDVYGELERWPHRALNTETPALSENLSALHQLRVKSDPGGPHSNLSLARSKPTEPAMARGQLLAAAAAAAVRRPGSDLTRSWCTADKFSDHIEVSVLRLRCDHIPN